MDNPDSYTTVLERFPECSEQIPQLRQRDADFAEMCSDYEELAQWLATHSHDDCRPESECVENRTLLAELEEEIAMMAPAYDGSVTNPPLFFNSEVFPNAKVWCEILHTYAAGGSFGTPVMADMASGHRHKFDECFLFLGSNPENVDDLGGEVEFWLGEGDEAEKYMLTESTAIYIPAGKKFPEICVNRAAFIFIFI